MSHLPMVIVPLRQQMGVQSSGSDRHVGATSCQVTTRVKPLVLQANDAIPGRGAPQHRNRKFIGLAKAVGIAAAIGNAALLAMSEGRRLAFGDPLGMTGHSTGTVCSPHEGHVTVSSSIRPLTASAFNTRGGMLPCLAGLSPGRAKMNREGHCVHP